MNPRLQLFPDTAIINQDTLTLAGCDLVALAEEHGTPLYLYDLATLDTAVLAYQSLLRLHYPAQSSITYAGKAYLSVSMAQWAAGHGLSIDCTGAGEIAIAVRAGLSGKRLVVHGVNKSLTDLQAAIQHAGVIVVDNLTELRRLATLSISTPLPDLWLRLQPGLAVDTHAFTQTGHFGSKFGMSFEDCLDAAEFCAQKELPLCGIHFHQGSQFRDPAPLGFAIQRALDLAVRLNLRENWHLSPGGGWGVAYHEDELPYPPLEEYIRYISESVYQGGAARNLTPPHLHFEPGRSIVARAGVAVYRVGAVKRSAGRTWLLLDGGMADNLRHSLYGAKYTALPVQAAGRLNVENVHMAGPFCESGDILIEDLPFPAIKEGELVAVPMSGAYHLSMSSNYNGALRPEVLLLENGNARVIQKRQDAASLYDRDIPL